MVHHPSDHNQFGESASGNRRVRRSPIRKLGKVLLLFLVGAFFPAAIYGWGDFYRNFAERNAPEVDLKEPPPGIGIEPQTINFTVEDTESGLDEVVVRITQGDSTEEIMKKRYPARQVKDELSITFNGTESKLREGDAELAIVAFDKSFWSNAKKLSMSFRVDYKRPQVEVVGASSTSTVGSAGLVFYQIQDRPDTFSGVKVGGELYPGFLARGLDSAFQPFTNLYCVLYPIPLEFPPSQKEQLRLFARDMVGNIGGSTFTPRVNGVGARERVIQLQKDNLDERLDAVYRAFLEARSRFSGKPVQEIVPSESDDERVIRFKGVSGEYREMIEQGVRALFSHPKQQRFWSGPFLRFAGKENVSFGEHITYKLDGRVLGSVVSTASEISGLIDTPIRAANSGVVIFADTLGPYGKTIIVDHGLGLTTMYSYLSATAKVEGDRVGRGEVVGRLGTTGLAFSPAVRYEMRLFGVPIRSSDWSDERWIEDNFEGTIRNVKKTLGVKLVRTLE